MQVSSFVPNTTPLIHHSKESIIEGKPDQDKDGESCPRITKGVVRRSAVVGLHPDSTLGQQETSGELRDMMVAWKPCLMSSAGRQQTSGPMCRRRPR